MVTEIVTSAVILILGIGLFVLIHVYIVGRTFRSLNSSTLVERSERSCTRTGSMSEEDIKKLPCYDFKLESEGSMVECVVCLERFKNGERCKVLPNCGHSFHGECIDCWLVKTGACPICRVVVDMGTGEREISS